jgi:hypothetical protein
VYLQASAGALGAQDTYTVNVEASARVVLSQFRQLFRRVFFFWAPVCSGSGTGLFEDAFGKGSPDADLCQRAPVAPRLYYSTGIVRSQELLT